MDQSNEENVSAPLDEGSKVSVIETEKKPSNDQRLYNDEEVDKIVARKKLKAFDMGRKAAIEEMSTDKGSEDNSESQRQIGGMPDLSDDKIRAIIEQESERRLSEQRAREFANNFIGKLEAGKQKHSESGDFDQVIEDMELPSMPHIVQMADSVDNTADVIYSLGKSPTKLASILMLAYDKPKLAQAEIKRLSESLKLNEEASNIRMPNDPLSQLKPSVKSTGDGNFSVSDLRRNPYLKA